MYSLLFQLFQCFEKIGDRLGTIACIWEKDRLNFVFVLADFEFLRKQDFSNKFFWSVQNNFCSNNAGN